MKAYNHTFTSNFGNVHTLGIVDFENGDFNIFFGKRRFSPYGYRVRNWVADQYFVAPKAHSKKSAQPQRYDDDEGRDDHDHSEYFGYVRRRRNAQAATPEQLLDYVKAWINFREDRKIVTQNMSEQLMALDNHS